MRLSNDIPLYFDYLIEGFRHGAAGRFVHLGHWDEVLLPKGQMNPDEFEYAQRKLNETILAMASLENDLDIIDIGCGFGGTLQSINEQYSSCQLTGINIDSRQLDICNQMHGENHNSMNWVLADACNLPFADNSFDRLLCLEAMFHFVSRRQFFMEASRILKPGGVMVASDITMHKTNISTGFSEDYIESVIRKWYGPWPDFWGKDAEHKELASNASLASTGMYDATANTLPTHCFTAPGLDMDNFQPDESPAGAAAMLHWLHKNKMMRYWYLRFDKPTTD
jgi:ubiquinone/menaquinone biosynthesis C-methylase UbiE